VIEGKAHRTPHLPGHHHATSDGAGGLAPAPAVVNVAAAAANLEPDDPPTPEEVRTSGSTLQEVHTGCCTKLHQAQVQMCWWVQVVQRLLVCTALGMYAAKATDHTKAVCRWNSKHVEAQPYRFVLRCLRAARSFGGTLRAAAL
jgi:hypothetical protein